MRSLLPRAFQKFSQGGRLHALAYIKPSRRSQFWLGEDTEVTSTNIGVTQIIESKEAMSSAQTYRPVPISEPQANLFVGLGEMRGARERATKDLGSYLRAQGYVVEPDVDPDFTYTITVTAHARVKAWPSVPAVTGSPFNKVGDVSIPFDSDMEVIWRAVLPPLHGFLDQVHHNMYRAVALAHPMTAHFARLRSITDYIGIVEDEEIPVGILRVCEDLR